MRFLTYGKEIDIEELPSGLHIHQDGNSIRVASILDINILIESLSKLKDTWYGQDEYVLSKSNHLDATHIGECGNPYFYYKAHSGVMYCLEDYKWGECDFTETDGLVEVNLKGEK